MKWTNLLILGGLATAGIAFTMGGKKCTVLDTIEKANRWIKRNENRVPKKFIVLGFYEPSWLDAFCSDVSAETVAIDFKALIGKDLKVLQDQGFSTQFPDENMVIAFRRDPEPQIYLVGGDGPEEAAAARVAIDQFLAGEIAGQPVTDPGGPVGTTNGTAKVKDLFGVFRG